MEFSDTRTAVGSIPIARSINIRRANLLNVGTMFGHLYPGTALPGLSTYRLPAPFFARFGSGSALSKS